MSEETIFALALEQPDAAARAAVLADACGTDAALRQRVEALLETHEKVGDFLDKPVVEQLAAAPEGSDATQAFNGSTNPKRPAMPRTEGAGSSDEQETPLDFLEPSARPDSLGRIGHYEVLQVLGQGGFGIVFRAFDEVLQRVVALKVLAPAIASTSPARKRFLREARSSAQVRHDNVVQTYAVEEKPVPYLVMEFIPGETLQQRLDRVGPFDVAEILRLGRQIAEGLAAAHATDLIHRDIKPGNVLLEGGHLRVKITDFGLARAADDASMTRSGVLAGTPMYMAPEQASGDALDHRADLFSLGSVLYQMTTGRPPFRATSTLAVLKRVAEDTPRPIREVIPETPQWLCDIIARLHAKYPDDRYQSAREVADVLADCEVQLKTNAKLKDFSRIPRRKSAPSGTRKWVAAAAVLLLPVLALAVTESAGVTHLFRGQQPAGRTDPLAEPNTAKDLPLAADAPTDLIPFARPGLSRGRWESQDRQLVHPARNSKGYPGLALAVRGPDDFDLESEFERTSGDEFIGFGMSSRGHRFMVALDAFGKWAGLQAVAGKLSNVNPTRRMGPWLTTGRRHTLRCEVRALGVRAWLDAREVVDYRGGYEVLGITPPDLPDWAQFFVQANDNAGFVVHKLVLTPRLPGPGANTSFDAKEAQEAAAKQLGFPVATTNRIGMKLRFIPAGKFMMGSSKEEIDFWLKLKGDGWYKDLLLSEGPQHEVEITQPFYMGQTDVTVGQFRQFVKATGYQTQAERKGSAVRGFPNGGFEEVANTNWLNPGYAQTDDHPVVCVSWNDAVEFCQWLSKEEGRTYRLPTEAEWEYSCRAGSKGRWSFGDNEGELWDYARVGGNSQNHSWPVAGLKANAWGLYDMHGNVTEYCQDLFDPNYYKTSPLKDPPGPAAGDERVIRGGFWLWGADVSRSAMRSKRDPAGRANFDGFRVVLVVSSPKTKSPPLAVGPFTDADVQRIAALPAPQQVEEVRRELKRRNPGFDGKMDTKIEGGVVTEIQIVTDKVADIAPIRVFDALRVLVCGGTLGPPTAVFPHGRPNGLLADLTPLEGMNLAGLTHLGLWDTKVSDAGLACFKDCKGLEDLNLAGTKVSDVGLAHFKNCKNLKYLWLDRTQVGDAGLAQLKGIPLRALSVDNTAVTDLTPLQGMPLEMIRLTPKNITRGLDILRDMKSLKTIGIANGQIWPAAEFWERYDKGEFSSPAAVAPFTDADVQRIAALPAAEQVEEVRKELMRRNPGFDGKLEHKIEGRVVTEFKIVTDHVTDIAPIRVFNALRVLECNGTWTDKSNGLLEDLTPLKGMNLTALTHLNLIQTKVTDAGMICFKDCKKLKYLNLNRTKVSDGGLAYFKDCKSLTILDLNNTKVTDEGLAHFKDCNSLTHLLLDSTKVSDAGLAHFDGVSLTHLWICDTGVTNLSPLQGMPLEEVRLTPKYITRGLDMLRNMKSLKTIGIAWDQDWPAAQFWQRYDKGEFKE